MRDDERMDENKEIKKNWDFRELEDVEAEKKALVSGRTDGEDIGSILKFSGLSSIKSIFKLKLFSSLPPEEEAKAQKALAARNREREQNKLRMRRVREAQRAAKEAEKVSASAG